VAEWDAERDLDEAVVRRVLAEQFPELDVDQIHPLATGWANSVWIVNHELAFRFPRRAIALPGVEREIMVLPPLAPRLPLAIPVPTSGVVPRRHRRRRATSADRRPTSSKLAVRRRRPSSMCSVAIAP
jgi:aminoglycoside phosphotransferase (APT) family kinase protein